MAAPFKFEFPETPVGTVLELWRALIRLLSQVEPKSATLKGVQIQTVETPLAHGLKRVPAIAVPVPHNSATVYQSKEPDVKYIYLRASSQCTCDVKVFVQ